jgi:hypothetical protein
MYVGFFAKFNTITCWEPWTSSWFRRCTLSHSSLRTSSNIHLVSIIYTRTYRLTLVEPEKGALTAFHSRRSLLCGAFANWFKDFLTVRYGSHTQQISAISSVISSPLGQPNNRDSTRLWRRSYSTSLLC